MKEKVQHTAYWVADYMVSALGYSTQENFDAINAYRSGIQDSLASIDWSRLTILPDYTRLENLFIHCLQQLNEEVSLPVYGKETALIFSTTKGNIDLLEKQDLSCDALYLSSMAKRVATYCGIVTEPIVVSNACISGITALIMAARLIEEGKYKQVIVAGGDLLTEFVRTGFESFKSVSKLPCRSYDKDRDGLSLGEACGVVLLSADQSMAGDTPLCLAGGGISNDSNHISGPSRTGDGLSFAMLEAIETSGVDKGDLAFINAHGTATLYNDEMESKALALAGLSEKPINSLKPYFGHTLGASGVIETLLSVAQFRQQRLFGTLGFKTLGTTEPLQVSALHQDVQGSAFLKLASGFGGCNAALVVSSKALKPVLLNSAEVKTIDFIEINSDGRPFIEQIKEAYRALNSPNMKFFKMDRLAKLGYVAAAQLLNRNKLDPSAKVAIVMANHASSLDTDLKHQKNISVGDASPAVFVYTLANIVVGEICIRHKIKGENTFLVATQESTFAEEYAQSLLKRGVADYVLLAWCELLEEDFEAKFTLLKL